ncbi:PiggyBac_transposable element-derived protein [Hexamita inflata]|uniref:PiggyBac_transposable element-derived protein n=1 Tax=Hexamita inflata TaxID=28002 RepID=A0ABP1I980_9EUKA
MSSKDAFRMFRQYFNENIVQRLCTETQVKLQQRIVNNKLNEFNKEAISQFDETQFWKFINVILVMILAPRTVMLHYWADNDIFGNAYIKKLLSRETFYSIYMSISWEQDETNLQELVPIINHKYCLESVDLKLY